jgi:hypothetical protein
MVGRAPGACSPPTGRPTVEPRGPKSSQRGEPSPPRSRTAPRRSGRAAIEPRAASGKRPDCALRHCANGLHKRCGRAPSISIAGWSSRRSRREPDGNRNQVLASKGSGSASWSPGSIAGNGSSEHLFRWRLSLRFLELSQGGTTSPSPWSPTAQAGGRPACRCLPASTNSSIASTGDAGRPTTPRPARGLDQPPERAPDLSSLAGRRRRVSPAHPPPCHFE